jgi:hypothetical protein
MKNEITVDQANERLKIIVNKVHPEHKVGNVGNDYIKYANKIIKRLDKIPEWLIKEDKKEDTFEFTPINWLPTQEDVEVELYNDELN